MKIPILVRQEVEIPDDAIEMLYRKTNELWCQEPDAPVYAIDLIHTAVRERVIHSPAEHYSTEDDEALTLEEWKEQAG